MAWASISLRKMELKNRINNLESELMTISQRLQTVAKQSSRQQQEEQLDANYQKALLAKDYQDAIDVVNNDKKSDSTKKQEALTKIQKGYNEKISLFESTYQMKSNSNKEVTDAQAKALEAEQEQIEAQLKAARAEYENLGQAVDTDIKSNAIKLV